MKRIILPFIFSCLLISSYGQTLDTIIYNGDENEYLNFVILGDGYTAADHAVGKLKTDATAFVNELLNHSPYSEYGDFMNFFIIERNSNQRGADHPANADDEDDVTPCDTVMRDTYYNCTFDFAGIHRLLVVQNDLQALLDASNLFPAYDQLLMLVNDDCYGGSGSSATGLEIPTASLNSLSADIAIHELGHSFVNLADEYYVNDASAREKPNMTQNTNPSTVRWKDWIGSLGVGIYQHDCPFRDANGIPDPAICNGNPDYDDFDTWYRPHQNCKMRFVDRTFCPVCKEATIDSIYSLVDPFSNKVPNLTSLFSFNGSNTQFGSDLIRDISNYTIEWDLNGSILPGRDGSFENFTYEDFTMGGNVLKLRVIDQTPLSKTYLPESGYIFELRWNVNKVDLCSDYIVKFPYENSFPIGSDAGQTTGDDFDWQVNSGQTGSTGTGPSQAYEGNTYLYAEATGQDEGDKAIFFTECFDLRFMNKPKMSFALHMFGETMGSLLIEISMSGGNNSELWVQFDKEQGEDWKEHEFDLEPYISPYTKISFIAVRGPDYQSDIAIDYLRIYDACPDNITLTPSQIGGGTFKAKYNITSTDIITSTTTYQAGRDIKLNGGFEVDQGRVFIARQGGCN